MLMATFHAGRQSGLARSVLLQTFLLGCPSFFRLRRLATNSAAPRLSSSTTVLRIQSIMVWIKSSNSDITSDDGRLSGMVKDAVGCGGRSAAGPCYCFCRIVAGLSGRRRTHHTWWRCKNSKSSKLFWGRLPRTIPTRNSCNCVLKCASWRTSCSTSILISEIPAERQKVRDPILTTLAIRP